MTKKPIIISFEVIGGINNWNKILPDLKLQLPLRNLHWKSSTRTIRTIQSLNCNFIPLFELSKKSIPINLLDRPYLHLLFVVGDDNEIYRATIRPQIREWLDSVISKHNQEWLIIHVTSTRSNSNSKFYQRKGSVIDKIRADFNAGKRDRCVQVASSLSDEPTGSSIESSDPAAWSEFAAKVKEGIISTFDANIALYEEDVRKADSQRQLEGWQYLTFFSQKEALAHSFETVDLLDDALVQYDELEAAFFLTMKEKNLASFGGKIGGPVSGDDSLPLLSTGVKPYVTLLKTNTISIFDFRIYLFARQASLLLEMGRIAEVAKRGAYFISTFARTLRQYQSTLGPSFVESWTYSATLDVVDECQRLIENGQVGSSTAADFVAVKAELLDLARKQLDKIGIESGHLPKSHPFSMSLNELSFDTDPDSDSEETPPPIGKTDEEESESAVAVVEKLTVSRRDLLDAMGDREAFDKLYVDLTNRAIRAYQVTRRKRCSLKLHASLAALEDHRQRNVSAQKLYSNLPSHYVDLRWVKIESSLLFQCTRLQKELEMPKERLLSTLALIRAGVQFKSNIWSLEPFDRVQSDIVAGELAKGLMETVYELSGTLTKDFAAISFPTFSMRLASEKGTTALEEDGVTVALILQSYLPCIVNVDEVRLKFSDSEGEQIWFTSGSAAISPGSNQVSLFCPTAVNGRLSLEISQIRYSRIIFQYSHRPISTRNLSPDLRSLPINPNLKQPVVYFPFDHEAVSVAIESPRSIALDRPREVVLVITTGRNDIVKVLIQMKANLESISFNYNGASVIEGVVKLLSPTEGGALLLTNLPPSSIIKVCIPINGDITTSSLEIGIVAEYYTAKRSTTKRILRRNLSYSVGLPLAVNVQDYFRKDCLLSKFTVATDGLKALRIKSAVLVPEVGDGDSIKSCRNVDSSVLTILPLQSASFLFKISRDMGKVMEDNTCRLTLTYCSVYEELIARVGDAVNSTLARLNLPDEVRWIQGAVKSVVGSAINLHWYCINGKLDHLKFIKKEWNAIVGGQSIVPERKSEMVDVIEKIYQTLQCAPIVDSKIGWRTLSIPVELPSLNILNLITVSSEYTRTEVGQPLPITITVTPSFEWSRSAISSPVRLAYNVVSKFEDWLVSGSKRGEFLAEPDHSITINLTLIPLRAGSLFLPSIAIRPFSNNDRSLTCDINYTNAALSIIVFPGVANPMRSNFSVNL